MSDYIGSLTVACGNIIGIPIGSDHVRNIRMISSIYFFSHIIRNMYVSVLSVGLITDIMGGIE